MDYIPFMSQFDQIIGTDHQELFHMISTLPCKLDPLDYQIHSDQNHAQIHPSTPTRDLTCKRRRPSNDQENPDDKKKKKKVLHREIERMRRKEMAVLCANLRSLIPLEYLKGKRSVSDQMCVATNYIQELQRKNQEFGSKRDELARLCDSDCNSVNDDVQPRSPCSTSVSVGRSRAGIEVLVNTALERGISLTTLLQALTEEGLDVISCVSARVRGRFLHSIESEIVTGEKSIELSNLEEKLKSLVV